jgi:hypothetical protein
VSEDSRRNGKTDKYIGSCLIAPLTSIASGNAVRDRLRPEKGEQQTRGLAVALAAGFLAGGIGAQSFAPLPAYATPMMGAPDSRGGVKEDRVWALAGQPCDNEYQLGQDTQTHALIVCKGGVWAFDGSIKLTIVGVTTGSPCAGQGGNRAESNDGYLNTCDPYTNVWVRGYGGPPAPPAPPG